jgi:HPt (histidine-containing phosphotransfer) domain-containing protein
VEEPEVVDRASLESLVAAAGGDRSFLVELIDAYLEDSPLQLAAMQRALQELATEDLRRAAHSLKSNSASLGATSLAAQCKDMEDIGHRGAFSEAAQGLARVQREYEKVARALQQIRARH